ncbi:MAG: hypothetical protein ACNA7M_15620, partial [Roseovarius sp.]
SKVPVFSETELNRYARHIILREVGGPGQRKLKEARVLVIGADERLEAVEVTLLRRQGNDILVAAPGLAGRDVVAERTPVLGAGIKVRRLESAAAAPQAGTVTLSPDRRARLMAYVEASTDMPEEAKRRLLALLEQPEVSLSTVERLERRIGG